VFIEPLDSFLNRFEYRFDVLLVQLDIGGRFFSMFLN